MTAASSAEVQEKPKGPAPETAEEGVEQHDETEVAPPELPVFRPKLRERIRESWEARALYPGVARSSIPTFQGKLLGRAWLYLIPIMQVVGFGAVLGGVFHAKAPNGVPYIVFMIFSTQAFRLLQVIVLFTTTSTKMQKSKTRGLRFPLLIIPFAGIARGILMYGVSFVIALTAIVVFFFTRGKMYLQLNAQLLIGIAGLLLILAFGLAIGLTTSALYPRATDIRYFTRYAMQVWFFFTPVLYSIQSLPHPYQVVMHFNPLTPLVGMVQYGFLNAGGLVPLYSLLWSLAAIALTGLFGLWFFNRFANKFVGVYQVAGADELDDGDIF